MARQQREGVALLDSQRHGQVAGALVPGAVGRVGAGVDHVAGIAVEIEGEVHDEGGEGDASCYDESV